MEIQHLRHEHGIRRSELFHCRAQPEQGLPQFSIRDIAVWRSTRHRRLDLGGLNQGVFLATGGQARRSRVGLSSQPSYAGTPLVVFPSNAGNSIWHLRPYCGDGGAAFGAIMSSFCKNYDLSLSKTSN